MRASSILYILLVMMIGMTCGCNEWYNPFAVENHQMQRQDFGDRINDWNFDSGSDLWLRRGG